MIVPGPTSLALFRRMLPSSPSRTTEASAGRGSVPASRRPSGAAEVEDGQASPDLRSGTAPSSWRSTAGTNSQRASLQKQKSLGPDIRRVVPKGPTGAKMNRSRTFSHGINGLREGTSLGLRENASDQGSSFRLAPGALLRQPWAVPRRLPPPPFHACSQMWILILGHPATPSSLASSSCSATLTSTNRQPPPPQGVCRRHRCTAWAPLRARGTRAPALHRAQEFKLFGDVDLPARASEDVHAAAADASEGVELQPTTSFTLFPISPETLNLEDRSSAWRLLACTAPCCVGRASPW